MKKLKKLIKGYGQPTGYSKESFKSLHHELLYLHPVTTHNKLKIVKCLQSITEALVYSDQHGLDFFDYFCTHNLQGILIRALKTQSFKDVLIQIFQTSTILVHNFSSINTKSKDYLGTLIKLPLYEELLLFPFDFDEEIIENYTSLMRSIAVNLPEDLLLEFITIRDFSLFSGATMFCFAKDSMVRTASRTVILTILRIHDPQIEEFVMNSGFFLLLINKVKEQLFLANTQKEYSSYNHSVSYCIDLLYYINDIIMQGSYNIVEELTRMFTELILLPILVESISAEHRTDYHISISLACFIIGQICRILKLQKLIDLLVSMLFVEENARAVLIGILRCKDDHLICLVLVIILNTLISNQVSSSILASSGLTENNFQKVELVETLLRLLSTCSSFKIAISHLIIKILYKLGIKDHHIFVTQAILWKLRNIESRWNSQNNTLDVFEEQWKLVTCFSLSEQFNCPSFLAFCNYEEKNISAEFRKPKGKTKKMKHEVYSFLLLLKLKYLTWNPEKCKQPISHLNISSYISQDNSDESTISHDVFRSIILENLENTENS